MRRVSINFSEQERVPYTNPHLYSYKEASPPKVALSTATIERVKASGFGRAAAISRIEEQMGWPADISYQLYRLNSHLFDALDWENNSVETKEEFSDRVTGPLSDLQEYLEQLKQIIAE